MSTLPSETVNMKIGIVGLIPPQIKQLEARLPGYDLTFLPRDIESKPANVSTFCKSMDKVILVTKFIGHKTCDHVPNSKRVLVSGGASMIIRRIKELMGCPITMVPANVAPMADIPASVYESGRIKPIHVRSEPVPTPIKPQKTQPQKPPVPQSREVLIVKPTVDGKYDFSILTAAVAGDTVRFPLPSAMEVGSWRTRMFSARHYYSKRSELSFVLEFHEKYADIKVIDPKVAVETAPAPTPEPMAKRTETAPLVTVGPAATPAPSSVELKGSPTPAVPVLDDAPVAEPAVTAPVAGTEDSWSGWEERQLWRESFIVCFQRGLSPTLAAAEADTVLTLYRGRFKISTPVG